MPIARCVPISVESACVDIGIDGVNDVKQPTQSYKSISPRRDIF